MGKGKDRADQGNTLRLCVNAEDCGRKREQRGGCETRKVIGGNYIKSSKYSAKKLVLYCYQ